VSHAINFSSRTDTHHVNQKDEAEVAKSGSMQNLLQKLANVLLEDAEVVKRQGQVEGGGGTSELDAYGILRNRDRSLVAELRPAAYLRVLKQASLKKSSNSVNQVIMDVLEVYRCHHTQRNNLIQSILSSADYTLLQRDNVLLMLRYLEKHSTAHPSLSRKSVERLARMIADSSPSSSKTDRAILKFVFPILLSHLKPIRVPPGALSLTYDPPALVHVSFSFLQKLLTTQQNQLALEVFEVLVDSKHIPPEAIYGMDTSSKDFRFIVVSALVRACLHWNWRALGAKFLTDMLRSDHFRKLSIFDLTVDTLYALLDTPTSNDVRACRSLICEIHAVAPVPDGLIRQFYNSAVQCMLGGEAEAFYAFARSPAVVESHQYPPPRGLALAWLMQHLTVYSKNTHLGRLLATQVMEGHEPIPIQYRARFIAITAAHGYATVARTWQICRGVRNLQGFIRS
jgi:hypothetical protein